jgi:hypothetical protein
MATPFSEKGDGKDQDVAYPPSLTSFPSQPKDDTEPPGRRQIGIMSAVFINFNTMVGTGIFATPSTILAQSGSVGMTL